MGVEFLQSNLTAGELDPRLHGRTDIEKYGSGVAKATNMVILPYGGLRRRPGLAKIPEAKVLSRARMLPFVFSTTQTYLIVLRPLVIDIYKDGVLVSTEVTTYTESELFDIDAIQSADTMIFAHQNHPPKQLQRQGSDTLWEFKSVFFTNLPYYNFGTVIIEKWVNSGTVYTVSVAVDEIVLNRDGNAVKGANYTYYKCKVVRASIDLSVEDFANATNWEIVGSQEVAWSAARGYPRTCTFFGNRLWFAGTTQQPTSIWGSKISGFFDFDLNDGDPDDAIADILDTDQYDIIQNIFAGRQLQVFTSGGELVNKADPVTPETSAWKKQTGYGSVKIKPILIDGATLFIDSSKRTVRQFLYDYNEDGNVSVNASLLSSHLITNAVAMSAITGTIYDVGDYVYVVNEDGTVAVLNTMRNEKITGWTHWVTDGRIEDVCVVGKVVYFLIERAGSRFIEILKEGTYTDHNVLIEGSPVTEIQTDYDTVYMNKKFKVIADYSIMGEFKPEGVADNNKFTINRDAFRLEVGLNFTTTIVTLPLATGTMKGTTYHRRKRVVKVDINVLESLGVYARNKYAGDREFTVVLDRAPAPFTGFKEMYLLGYSRLAEIEISQKDPLPFTLRAIGYEIEY